jgi:hypothetical protein
METHEPVEEETQERIEEPNPHVDNVDMKTEVGNMEKEPNDVPSSENTDITLNFEEIPREEMEIDNELKEINDLPLENVLEPPIQLKKPNEVYYELYKEARNKAKMAKRNALQAYLEAKNIKKTYMVENIEDSDSDLDAEIEELSENEL